MADSNTCRNLFYECEEQLKCSFKKSEEESENFLNDLRKGTETFLRLVHKKAKALDSDIEALNILMGGAENESDLENVPNKKGRGRKKKPLAESNEDNLEVVKIKQEKISVDNQSSEVVRSSITSTSSVSEIPVEEIKSEKLDMPAPTWIPPKKKPKEVKAERASVRRTRTKGKKASVRDSDVVVQSTIITTINLCDGEESDRPVRSTRTKTRKAQAQSQSDSGTETDTESTRSTRIRNKKEEQNSEENLNEETRTRTVRKGKKAEEDESQKDEQEEIPPTRSTRTKTNRKAAKEAEESANINNNNKEEAITETTRSTRTKTRKPTEKEEQINDSEKSSDTSKESEANNTVKAKKVEAPVESINQGGAKRNRSNSTDEETNNKKRSKSTSPVQEIEANSTTQTVYEDAHSVLGPSQEKSKQHLNCTYVADLPVPTEFMRNSQVSRLDATVTIDPIAAYDAHSTIVIDKPHLNNVHKKSDNALLTDDDDDDEVTKTPPKKAAPIKAGKEVFSPYEKTTLKKKVEAFEKLQNGSDIPLKLSTNLRSVKGTPISVHEKAKMFTPLGSTFMPGGSSTSKISRLINNRNDSTSNDSLSAIKLHGSAQKDARDRQRRLMERELAQKKKEAMLKKQAEDKKKLNEEKQLKAQQQRKALEAEKLKQLQIQKQKEERHKQRELEREEYLQKQKLEAEKKRQAQKKKIQEIQEQRQKILEEQAKNPPVYMVTKLPKLPTNDCYDSDDPDYEKVTPPIWCFGEQLRTKQLTMLAAGEKIKNTFFCRKPQTANLVDIFEVIDPKKLKRSSSRYWKAPPRYTMMPDLNETKFSEDDELYDSD